MMILADKTLRKLVANDTLHIHPTPKEDQFQPSSIDLKLDYKFTKYNPTKLPCIDTKANSKLFKLRTENIKLKYKRDSIVIQPNEFILAQTLEKVRIPDNMVGIVEGRSSFGRLGLLIHVTAGYIDPGFEGNITLEIKNINNIPIVLYPESRICQLVIHQMDRNAEYPYGCERLGSKYQFQNEPTPSRIQEE